MSYSCRVHGWQHMLNPCPSCVNSIYASGSAFISPQNMTAPKNPPPHEAAGEFPPRISMTEILTQAHGREIAVFLHDRACFIPNGATEYISLAEHTAAVAAARAEAWTDAANFVADKLPKPFTDQLFYNAILEEARKRKYPAGHRGRT